MFKNKLTEDQKAFVLEWQKAFEEKKAERIAAETESWQADPHKKMFGRYSSEWD